MSESAGRPAMARSNALSVAERLDFLGEAVLFLDRDPLENLDPFLELAHFVAQALVLDLRLAVVEHDRMTWAPEDRLYDRAEHDDRDDRDCGDLPPVHQALSSSEIRSWSRSASICAAVSAPRSVTIRSSTRMRSCNCCTWERRRSFSALLTGGSPRISRMERAGIPSLCLMMLKANTRMRTAMTNSNGFIVGAAPFVPRCILDVSCRNGD